MDSSLDRMMKYVKAKLDDIGLAEFDVVYKKPNKRFPKGAVVAEYGSNKSTSLNIAWTDVWLFIPTERPNKSSLICRYNPSNMACQMKALSLIESNLDAFYNYLFTIQESKPWADNIAIGSEHEEENPILMPINILTKDGLRDYIKRLSNYKMKCLDIRTDNPLLFEQYYSGDLFPSFIKDTLSYYKFLKQEIPLISDTKEQK